MISIILPAHNVAGSLADLVEKLARWEDVEIIIAEDGSTDQTREIAQTLAERHRNVRLSSKERRAGKGAAIRRGFGLARGQIVIFMDADGAVDPLELRKLVTALGDWHVVIGSRWLRGARVWPPQPLGRRIASRAFNLLVRLIFGLPFSDTQCGAKVFRREAIAHVLPELISRGFELDVELLWRLRTRGYQIREIPISWRGAKRSSLSLSVAPRLFLSLLKIRLRT